MSTAISNEIHFLLNGEDITVTGRDVFLNLGRYLREERMLPATKLVCEEGDCGSCTVLAGDLYNLQDGDVDYKIINSCIAPLHSLAGCHIVTAEGLTDKSQLSEIQSQLIAKGGTQCGYCTPGFATALTGLFEKHKDPNPQDIKNHLTGNLCRCTGYQSIINAALSVDSKAYKPLNQLYPVSDLKQNIPAEKISIEISDNGYQLFMPVSADEALALKSRYGESLSVSNGFTDIGVEINKKNSPGKLFLSLHQIHGLYEVAKDDQGIHIGANVTLQRLQKYLKQHSLFNEFQNLMHIFASPQIKNRGTLVGNIANGSPIGDTTPFFMVAGASVIAQSINGKRSIPLDSFYISYKTLELKPDEIITHISLPKSAQSLHYYLYKVSKRKDLDISSVTAAFAVNKSVDSIQIAFGGIGPTVTRFPSLEALFSQNTIDAALIEKGVAALHSETTPLSDVRGSNAFRNRLTANLLRKFYYDYQQSVAKGDLKP